MWIGVIQDRSRKRNTDQTSPQQLGTVPNARRICNPNNAEQFPAGSIQQIKEYRSRHAFSNTKSIHLQTLKCTDQGKRIKDCNSKHRPNNSEQFPAGSIRQIKEYRSWRAFPNTKSMHLQTLKCTDQGKRIKECNSKHRPNNATTQQLGTVPISPEQIKEFKCTDQ